MKGEITRQAGRHGGGRASALLISVHLPGWKMTSVRASQRMMKFYLNRFHSARVLISETENKVMKTKPSTRNNTIHAVSFVPKLAIFSALALLIGSPLADAKPKHGKGGHSHHSDYHRESYHPSKGYDRRDYRPEPPRRVVYRNWSRPGFRGVYPPDGYVNYRYTYALPRGYRTVYRDGFRYFYVNGVYYWPATYNNRGIFIQVSF
ncbi:hypothetical protein JIN85_09500 [Luteolibacter pohnpeiensis]|uniref:Uncharacterized protein n=1 Tax=Luteolibacter pohnpeiensis TaxID=454153 RepID=A0A934VR02_9BACT|nr:hypothetical protein [Luteolibacter pohnpeiensis]MBK1882651.1 hypothetical protein [Luteolibacter pohnpeiensis]